MKEMKGMINSDVIKPKILYYGTPVILLNTLNEDDTVNISPISSSWALGDYIILGIGLGGKAIENLERHPECVINLPDPSLWENVEQLAPHTGKYPVPDGKAKNGFTYEKDKYAISGLTPADSVTVKPTRIMECPIQIEAAVKTFGCLTILPCLPLSKHRRSMYTPIETSCGMNITLIPPNGARSYIISGIIMALATR